MMIEMHIYLVQENPFPADRAHTPPQYGAREAVVIARSPNQARSVADSDSNLVVNEHTLVTRLGTCELGKYTLPLLVLTGVSPYGTER
jgi:hypothetical protein